MWKTFQCVSGDYIIKLIITDDVVLWLSNLRVLWKEEVSLKDCLHRFEEINPFLEITEEGIKEHIATLMNNIGETRIIINQNELGVSLTMEASLGTFNIKFRFALLKLPDDKFFSEVTTPLIATIKYLEESQKMMRDLLNKKDRELEEHKLEKGNISRADLITKPLVNTTLENSPNNSLMLNLFSNNIGWNQFSQTFNNIELDNERDTNKVSSNGSVKRKIYSSKSTKRRLC